EVGLRLVNAKKEDLLDNVKLAGSISFLIEAKDSDVVITL
ncbi:MAG: peroxiredoxin, partial [Saccharolobus sp.]